VYCPTEEMLANYFTKPLQGALFHKFCAVIMRWAHVSTLILEPSSPPNGSNDVKIIKLTYAEALKIHGRGKTNEQKSSATGFDKAGKGVNKKVSFFLFNPVR